MNITRKNIPIESIVLPEHGNVVYLCDFNNYSCQDLKEKALLCAQFAKYDHKKNSLAQTLFSISDFTCTNPILFTGFEVHKPYPPYQILLAQSLSSLLDFTSRTLSSILYNFEPISACFFQLKLLEIQNVGLYSK